MYSIDGNPSEVELLSKGYRLLTAEFIYRMPDHTSVLNSFIWQEYDLHPDFPELFGFMEFWKNNIEGKLAAVRVGLGNLMQCSEWRNVSLDVEAEFDENKVSRAEVQLSELLR